MFTASSIAWSILSFVFAIFLTLVLILLCLVVTYTITLLAIQMFNKSEDN